MQTLILCLLWIIFIIAMLFFVGIFRNENFKKKSKLIKIIFSIICIFVFFLLFVLMDKYRDKSGYSDDYIPVETSF